MLSTQETEWALNQQYEDLLERDFDNDSCYNAVLYWIMLDYGCRDYGFNRFRHSVVQYPNKLWYIPMGRYIDAVQR